MTGASIVCLQETKIELLCSSVVLDTLGSEFDDYTYLPVQGTRGGILLAWKSRAVSISDPLFTNTAVYGPQDDAAKVAFLDELREISADTGCGCYAATSTSSSAPRTRTRTTSIGA